MLKLKLSFTSTGNLCHINVSNKIMIIIIIIVIVIVNFLALNGKKCLAKPLTVRVMSTLLLSVLLDKRFC